MLKAMNNPILTQVGKVAEAVVNKLFANEKAVVIIGIRGETSETIMKFDSVQEAKAFRAELFAQRIPEISYALVAKEADVKL
jgi:hypothetical protein